LSATNLDHQAPSDFQCDRADPLFTVNLDYGPAHKRFDGVEDYKESTSGD
jgi:hypothetical protein